MTHNDMVVMKLVDQAIGIEDEILDEMSIDEGSLLTHKQDRLMAKACAIRTGRDGIMAKARMWRAQDGNPDAQYILAGSILADLEVLFA